MRKTDTLNIETDEFASLLPEPTNAQIARDLASQGYPVFPVRIWTEGEALKPIPKWRQRASTNAEQVASWWQRWPDACVALATGEASGISVLDVDIKNGKDGVVTLADLGIADPKKLSPVRVRTPSGGWHFYFRNDPRLRTSAGALGQGIDIRADGGFIFALGSQREGGRYVLDGSGLENSALPPFPEALLMTKRLSGDVRPVAGSLDFEPGELEAVLDEIPVEIIDDRDSWVRIGAALYHQCSGSDEGFRLWMETSKRGLKYLENSSEKSERRRYDGFGRSRRVPVTLRTVLKWAPLADEARNERLQQHLIASWLGQLDTLPPATVPLSGSRHCASSKHRLLTPAECAETPTRGYVVKGLLAPRDVACVYGAPGAGKSLCCPYIGYMVALGTPAFGMRTRKGPVLYVAAEDPHGMRARVNALRRRHGDTDQFLLVEGISDLLTAQSTDFEWLGSIIQELAPSLIFIDTLAVSFPGLEENTSEAMGKVVTTARALTRLGAAVVLVHHDTKAQSPTPRGHSILNGALDVALQLFTRDDLGVVRGKLSKNRNGSSDREIAFKIGVEELGDDDDGDTITVAVASEVSPSTARRRPRLTPSQSAALETLKKVSDPTTHRCDEAEWRAACIDGRLVSAAEERDSRRKATDRAIQTLCQKRYVAIASGLASLLSADVNAPTSGAFDQPDM